MDWRLGPSRRGRIAVGALDPAQANPWYCFVVGPSCDSSCFTGNARMCTMWTFSVDYASFVWPLGLTSLNPTLGSCNIVPYARECNGP